MGELYGLREIRCRNTIPSAVIAVSVVGKPGQPPGSHAIRDPDDGRQGDDGHRPYAVGLYRHGTPESEMRDAQNPAYWPDASSGIHPDSVSYGATAAVEDIHGLNDSLFKPEFHSIRGPVDNGWQDRLLLR